MHYTARKSICLLHFAKKLQNDINILRDILIAALLKKAEKLNLNA